MIFDRARQVQIYRTVLSNPKIPVSPGQKQFRKGLGDQKPRKCKGLEDVSTTRSSTDILPLQPSWEKHSVAS